MWDLAIGFSIGNKIAAYQTKEEEIKQGKNNYLASFFQVGQISNLSQIAGALIPYIPHTPSRVIAQIANTTLPFVGLATCPVAAAVKEGHYEAGAKFFNKSTEETRLSLLAVPEELSPRTNRLFTYLADNAGNMARVGTVIGALTLPMFVGPYLTAAMVTPIVFERLDSNGWIPQSISLAAEKHMPALTETCLFFSGGLVAQLFSAASLATRSTYLSQRLHRRAEGSVSSYFQLKGATLEEIDAPLVERKELTFDQINLILGDPRCNFEINPAHCSKAVYEFSNLPEDGDLSKFLTLFDAINWNNHYVQLKNKFRDDDRFIEDFKAIINVTEEELVANFEKYILEQAVKEDKTKEHYLSDQLKLQMIGLVNALLGTTRIKGSQQDLQDAIANCKKILAHLTNASVTTVEMEDALLKLAVEGGEYCARGVKRASQEILCGIVYEGLQSKSEEFDPLISYEQKVRQSLELTRSTILQSIYQKLIETITLVTREGFDVKISQNAQTTDTQAVAIAQDVHTLDLYRHYLSLGFYPLTQNERNAFGFSELMNWSLPVYREIRSCMYSLYFEKLDDTLKEIGELHFANHLRALLEKNSLLNEQQCEEILDKYMYSNNKEWSFEETQKKFHRLFFVILGVLRHDTLYEDWVEMETTPDDLTAALEADGWTVMEDEIK